MTATECRKLTEAQLIQAMIDLNRRIDKSSEEERTALLSERAVLKSELFRR